MPEYSIQTITDALYLDKAGKAVSGYTVYVLLTEFDEVHNFNVSSLAENVVKPMVETLLKQRKALANLGTNK